LLATFKQTLGDKSDIGIDGRLGEFVFVIGNAPATTGRDGLG
jgi:hypothetical protein